MKKSKIAIAGLLAALCLSHHCALAEDKIIQSPMEIAGLSAADAFDLNSITLDQLKTLPGIGPSKAQAILDYRDEKGAFIEVDQLTEVRGIGQTLLAKVRDKLKVVKH